jgi:hypothetical protein
METVEVFEFHGVFQPLKPPFKPPLKPPFKPPLKPLK